MTEAVAGKQWLAAAPAETLHQQPATAGPSTLRPVIAWTTVSLEAVFHTVFPNLGLITTRISYDKISYLIRFQFFKIFVFLSQILTDSRLAASINQ